MPSCHCPHRAHESLDGGCRCVRSRTPLTPPYRCLLIIRCCLLARLAQRTFPRHCRLLIKVYRLRRIHLSYLRLDLIYQRLSATIRACFQTGDQRTIVCDCQHTDVVSRIPTKVIERADPPLVVGWSYHTAVLKRRFCPSAMVQPRPVRHQHRCSLPRAHSSNQPRLLLISAVLKRSITSASPSSSGPTPPHKKSAG